MSNNSVNYFEFGPVVRRCRLKTSFLSRLLQPIGSDEQNHLCNFGRGHHEEQLICKIILSLDQWFRRR